MFRLKVRHAGGDGEQVVLQAARQAQGVTFAFLAGQQRRLFEPALSQRVLVFKEVGQSVAALEEVSHGSFGAQRCSERREKVMKKNSVQFFLISFINFEPQQIAQSQIFHYSSKVRSVLSSGGTRKF